ncbi:MAG: haloalkane dehalogenase [Pacificimonas sp.]|jgi:haloalkane dehalogenase|nr:haloalkane dehalogenase [Pacificimonas sp.]
MTVLRTPEARFEQLPDFDFPVAYTTITDEALGDIRIAHVEAGPEGGPKVLLMHGEPSWSFLYRKMIAVLVDGGARVYAPDLVGFGRSDKPEEKEAYTYANHVRWMQAWFDAQRFQDLTLFCQDWGGLLGLRLVAANADRFAGVVASNTFLPTGEGKPSEGFLNWRKFSQAVPDFDSGMILQGATTTELSADEVSAYNAPFPDDRYKAGARMFPLLVPISEDDPEAPANRKAWAALERFEKPFLTLFGSDDPVTRGSEEVLQARIPGAKGQPHRIIEGGHHFIQEDAGPELAKEILAMIARRA